LVARQRCERAALPERRGRSAASPLRSGQWNSICAETLNRMTRRHSELSTAAILAISIAITMVGCVVYLIATPIPPAKIVALEHAAMSEPIAR
jgi:hypothetical protein